MANIAAVMAQGDRQLEAKYRAYGPPQIQARTAVQIQDIKLTSRVHWESREFKYNRLTEPIDGVNQIRLLCIQPDTTPGIGGASSPLSIKLYHTPLRRGMKTFSALSYFRGDGEDLVAVKCNEGWLKITRSLYTLLRAVRNRTSSSREPAYIWTDAICINHQDKAEKSYQVALMRDVYRRASRVIVWLGDADRDTDLALPILPLLARAAQKQRAAWATTHVVAMQKEDWARVGLAMPDAELRLRVRAFHRLLRRDWFKRIWVVHEYALARSVIFMCGSGEFSQDELIRATTFTAESQMDVVMGSGWVDSALQPLHNLRTEIVSAQNVTLMSLLKRYQGFDAADPRDKVFSLLAVASDAGKELGGLNIEVDYDAPARDVYQLVAMKLIFRDRNLEIVTLGGTYTPMIQPEAPGTQQKRYHRLAGLPSWVPDWSVPDTTSSIQQPLTKFRASGSSGHNPNFAQIMSGKLQVRCQFLDTISTLGKCNSVTTPVPDDWVATKKDSEDSDEALRMLALFSNWINVFGADADTQKYFTGESMLDVLWQSMSCGHHTRGVEMERRLFMEWYRSTSKVRMLPDNLRSKSHARKLALDAYNSYTMALGGYGEPTSYTAPSTVGTRNRGGFRAGESVRGESSSGFSGYAGMAPKGAQVGDWLVILEGASVPMILRQKVTSSDEWEVVGACYAHGCMSGQVFDSSKCKEIILV